MFDWILNPFLHALYQRCQLVETGQKTEKIIIQLQLGGRVTRATFDLILYLPNRTKFLVNFQITHFCICSSQRHFQLQKCDILYSMRKSHNVIIRKIKLLINPPKLPYIHILVTPQFSVDLVTFTEEILNGKHHFLVQR